MRTKTKAEINKLFRVLRVAPSVLRVAPLCAFCYNILTYQKKKNYLVNKNKINQVIQGRGRKIN
jgi:hypothetical protein